ncbi:four helix bundle protein [Vicingus serpentipes]|uniref:Four helix bundle protein n=1 Tax=Vicingus serpentipes TaxID=1926625 RepID=A0A5C6RRW4_9FLAO|nr:four helix bundle protein [Vicingus serpentipes]TXB64645.1 four helix bundle protein [Vicingus serpentipes]
MKLEDLKLYQECLDFEDKIWKIVNAWEGFNKDTIGVDFVKDADAISGNIAAGYGRYNFKDKKHYCYISRGFLLKTKGWLLKAKERGMIEAAESDELVENVEKIHRMLNAYIRSIGRKKEDNYERNNNYNNDSEDLNSNDEPNGNAYTASADEFFSEEEISVNA